MQGPQLPLSLMVHEEKYREPGETYQESIYRQARGMADDEEHEEALVDLLGNQRFLAGGRVQAAAGSDRRVTAFNCFVSRTITDSMSGIMRAATEAAETLRRGGGIGYDFSTIRPRGANIKSFGTPASGPVSFMAIFDAVCATISSAGNRRGAMMATLRVDHPDIYEFVRAKQNSNSLTNFNISVLATDEFMSAVLADEPFDLRFDDEVYDTVRARELWDEIMRSTWMWAEPGVIFIDRINEMNNLWYAEEIASTNPCGEQPLPPYGACLLGSLNLVKYVRDGDGWGRYLDLDQLEADIPTAVAGLDNIIDRTLYPLNQQQTEARMKRRMGIGVTGLANTLEGLGMRYGTEEAAQFTEKLLSRITNTAYLSSAHRAREKGSFPLFDRDHFLASHFVQKLDPEVREAIALWGIRNSHLTSIAPTGTISITADNVSSGIEPVFSYAYTRDKRMPDGTTQTFHVEDYGHRVWGVEGRKAGECPPEDHLRMLAAAQRWVDSACSKTINLSGDETWEEFEGVYLEAWGLGAKGCTTFNPKGGRMGILNEAPEKSEEPGPEGAACFIDPDTGQPSCS